MADKKIKYGKLTVEMLDNGFVVERYGFNPYGGDLKSKLVRSNMGEVIGDLAEMIAHNTQLDAESKAEKEKEGS